ncbi:MAG TPA: hypothetical protein PKX51_20275, partial [Cyclobacteriaceae bacterium]|nr:hypothetical protein [Cyclobacteriaceae bacterium]
EKMHCQAAYVLHIILEGNAQRVALLGWRIRPTGKMFGRRKRLGITARLTAVLNVRHALC